MDFIASQIALLLEGDIIGNESVTVNNLSKIEEGKKGTLSFLSNLKYETYLYTTNASIVIVDKSFEPSKDIPEDCTLIKVESAAAAFSKLLEMYNQVKQQKTGINPNTYISESAKLGKEIYMGAFVSIGENVTIGNNVKIYSNCSVGDNVSIGDNSVLYSGVHIYSDCEIGSGCIFHSGVVIGGDGFGFVPNSENNYAKTPQIGNVIIEDFVEIGANSAIDRATLGSTIIRKGVKLDNLIQVAHNVEIGENTVIAAQSGVAGSTKVGKNCMVGGQTAITGHIKVADRTKVAGKSGVTKTIRKEGKTVQGNPAFEINDFMRSYVMFKKLPELTKKVTELENKLTK